MSVVKVTLTFSDGTTHDFLSMEDAVKVNSDPALHPDAPIQAPVEEPEKAAEVEAALPVKKKKYVTKKDRTVRKSVS